MFLLLNKKLLTNLVILRLMLGLPWWSSGWDSALPMQGAWVRSLDKELDPVCSN